MYCVEFSEHFTFNNDFKKDCCNFIKTTFLLKNYAF